MKAILVIDVPLEDSIDFGHLDIRANVKVEAFDDLRFTFKPIEFKHVKVEAMPEKKGISLKEAMGIKCSCYSDGWNDCIDEILGDIKDE